jgi:hypothetical protein
VQAEMIEPGLTLGARRLQFNVSRLI